MALYYVDASALVKLILDERETAVLRTQLEVADLVSNQQLAVEAERAVRRSPLASSDAGPHLMRRLRHALSTVMLVRTDDLIARSAGQLPPVTLRTLDAVHLATAQRLGPELDAFICYDERLAAAAAAGGMRVLAPGAR